MLYTLNLHNVICPVCLKKPGKKLKKKEPIHKNTEVNKNSCNGYIYVFRTASEFFFLIFPEFFYNQRKKPNSL